MSVEVVVALVVGLLILLLLAQAPVAFALIAAGMTGIILLQGLDLASVSLARAPYQATSRYTLVVVPMFIFMGLLAMHAGIAEGAFRVGNKLFGRLPGGLGVATVFVCAAFAAVSGSSPATVATVGRMSIGEMRKQGYSVTLAAGIVGAAGTLGVLIPPSIILVLYGIVTGVSVGVLLIAGIIPGLVTALAYGIYVVARVKADPSLVAFKSESPVIRAGGGSGHGPPVPDQPAPQAGVAVGPTGDGPAPGLEGSTTSRGAVALAKVGVLFFIVIGGIYSGVVTATESAALGASAALLIMIVSFLRRGGLLRRLGTAMQEAASVTSMVFAIVVGATIFSVFLVSAGVPAAVTQAILAIDIPPLAVVALLLLLMVPLGMFLDSASILLITMPVAYPVVSALGVDGVWFGVLTVKMIEIGLITPPVGINAYVVAGAADDLSVEQAFRGVLPFVWVDIAVVALLFAFPDLVTVLPRAMDG